MLMPSMFLPKNFIAKASAASRVEGIPGSRLAGSTSSIVPGAILQLGAGYFRRLQHAHDLFGKVSQNDCKLPTTSQRLRSDPLEEVKGTAALTKTSRGRRGREQQYRRPRMPPTTIRPQSIGAPALPEPAECYESSLP
jgi:hypothetical protein